MIYKKISNILTCLIPFRKIRRSLREKLRRKIMRIMTYTVYRKKFKKFIKIMQNSSGFRFIMHTMRFDFVLFQRPQQIALQLAKLGHLVVYADDSCETFKKLSNNLYVANPAWIINKECLSTTNIYFFALSTDNTLGYKKYKEIKDSGCNIIYEYIDEIDPDIFGDISMQLETHKNLESLAPCLIITTAKKLQNEMINRFSKNIVLLNQNGVDIKNFINIDKAVIPNDMIDIVCQNKPIIGYYGAIAPWLNYDLLNELHAQRPNLNFVYIGIDFNNSLKNLKPMPNVYYLGPKHYTCLGKYAAHFDCCTIPFAEGEIAQSTSPLKLFEYMALKKPVVITKDLFEGYGYEGVLVSSDTDDFIANIDRAIKLSKDIAVQEKLFSYANQNTWENRAQCIVTKLNELNG